LHVAHDHKQATAAELELNEEAAAVQEVAEVVETEEKKQEE
jgi:hypothetical protein